MGWAGPINWAGFQPQKLLGRTRPNSNLLWSGPDRPRPISLGQTLRPKLAPGLTRTYAGGRRRTWRGGDDGLLTVLHVVASRTAAPGRRCGCFPTVRRRSTGSFLLFQLLEFPLSFNYPKLLNFWVFGGCFLSSLGPNRCGGPLLVRLGAGFAGGWSATTRDSKVPFLYFRPVVGQCFRSAVPRCGGKEEERGTVPFKTAPFEKRLISSPSPHKFYLPSLTSSQATKLSLLFEPSVLCRDEQDLLEAQKHSPCSSPETVSLVRPPTRRPRPANEEETGERRALFASSNRSLQKEKQNS
ncbi:hypothetical protein NC652_033025 [Populus alba x Populus x berolinensis]|nr:hypothetical protein NC652_033025 [Populus alba x Populus x berolinensis]